MPVSRYVSAKPARLSHSIGIAALLALWALSPPARADKTDKSDSDSSSSDSSSGSSGEDKGEAKKVVPNNPPEAGVIEWDITDTREDPNKTYRFLGLKYRGTVIPQAFENIFVADGATVYSNSLSVEIELRKGQQSTTPWIMYTDYNTGDIMFLQKNAQGGDITQNRSVVNSSLKAIYLGVDEMWSFPLDERQHVAFEIGFGVGIGGVFGNLMNNWVYQDDANGQYQAQNGHRYSKCTGTDAASHAGTLALGCNTADHQNSSVAKINGYNEPSWFGGGSVPAIFPHIALPQLAIRYKPIKQLQMRLETGMQLTGWFFQFGVDYGLEQKPTVAIEPPKAAYRSPLSGAF